jgi:hypothetical protein
MAKSLNRSFGFEAKIGKPEAIDFEVKTGETVDLGFEAKPRNPRLLVHDADHT